MRDVVLLHRESERAARTRGTSCTGRSLLQRACPCMPVLSLRKAMEELAAQCSKTRRLPDLLCQRGDGRKYSRFLDTTLVIWTSGTCPTLKHKTTLAMTTPWREVVRRAVETDVDRDADANVLIHGFRRAPLTGATSSASLVNHRQAPTADALSTPEWDLLHARAGDALLLNLLLHASVFVPLPNRCLLQVCGPVLCLSGPENVARKCHSAQRPGATGDGSSPVCEPSTFQGKDAAACETRTAGARVEWKSAGRAPSWARKRSSSRDGAAQASLSPAPKPASCIARQRVYRDVVIPRSTMFYSATQRWRPGLPYHHPLNTLSSSTKDLADLWARIFMEPGAGSTDPTLPASLASRDPPMFELLRLLHRRTIRCPFGTLLDRHCPLLPEMEPPAARQKLRAFGRGSRLGSDAAAASSRADLERRMDAVHATLTSPGEASRSHQAGRIALQPAFEHGPGTPMTQASLVALAMPHAQVSAFAWACVRRCAPPALLGPCAAQKQLRCVVSRFVSLRRYEEPSLSFLTQGVKDLGPGSWTAHTGRVLLRAFMTRNMQGHRCGTARPASHPPPLQAFLRQAQVRWLAWLLSEFVLPLLRTCFYATEGETGQGNGVLYYRKPLWRALERRAVGEAQEQGRYELVSTSQAAELAASKAALSLAQLRFVPKAQGLRPIATLGRGASIKASDSFQDPNRPPRAEKRRRRAKIWRQEKRRRARGADDDDLSVDEDGDYCRIDDDDCCVLAESPGPPAPPPVPRRPPVGQPRAARRLPPVNVSLREAAAVLAYEVGARPACVAGTSFGASDSFCALRRCLRAWHREISRGAKGSLRPSVACVDVAGAYDCMDHSIVLDLVSRLVQSPSYAVFDLRSNQSHGVSFPGRGGGLRAVRLDAPGAAAAQPLLLRMASQAARTGPPSRVLLPGTAPAGSRHARNFTAGSRLRLVSRDAVLRAVRALVNCTVLRLGHVSWARQRLGVPQGSSLSTLLCALYLSSLSHRHLEPLVRRARGQNAPPELTTLVRRADDFLLLTPDADVAHAFVQRMEQGFADYGVRVNPSKTRLWCAEGDGEDSGFEEVPWCGLSIDPRTLAFGNDYTRGGEQRVAAALTVPLGRSPWRQLGPKLACYLRLRLSPLVLHAGLSDRPGPRLRALFRACQLCAMRMHCYLRALRAPLRPALLVEAWQGLVACAVRSCRPSVVRTALGRGVAHECVPRLSARQVTIVALEALLRALQRKQTSYGTLLDWARGCLEQERSHLGPRSRLALQQAWAHLDPDLARAVY